LALQTAEEGILKGSVRNVIIDYCRQHRFTVLFQAPRLEDRHRWLAAFITSTSRMLLPLSSISFPDHQIPDLELSASLGGDFVKTIQRALDATNPSDDYREPKQTVQFIS